MKQMTFLQYWMVVFFTVHSVSGEKVVAKCNKCNPAKPISGSYAATSNFLLHLKRVHPSLIHEFENYRDTVQREKKTLHEKAAKMTSMASQVKSRQSWISPSQKQFHRVPSTIL
jgi:hypothetical protein